ncbi:NAD(P)-dependent oxidoreductase [Brevibacillus dissolubilis]|uniref:NAD(P)-dependent oxidoreductase n=1 Tax=Brevibacillus dissolubilis TaxID=1844116 RepID=UPI001116EFAD|nr:NAD(P)H-binding protein [Brevibacillus dissolubilis]
MDRSYQNQIALIGGTGKVGRHLASKALEHGYRVRMLVRNPQKLSFRDDRIEILEGSVQNPDSIRQLLTGCHIVVNAFGQPMKDTPIYSSVTQQILATMTEMHIRRYIGVTGGSLNLEGDNKGLLNRIGAKMFELFYSEMIQDKKKEVEILRQHPHLDWTLIRLPFVVEGPEWGGIKESLTDLPGLKMTNQDIAHFLMNQVDDKTYIHQTPFIAT